MVQKYIAFIGLCLGFFIIMMDTTTVPLIYTTLMQGFDVSPVMVAWVNNTYLITYAAFLLLGGRLGDFTNRKIVVLIAYLTIGIGAAISGVGQTFTGVIIGRALMGVGAGLLTPQSMAYITILFGSGGRGTALGIWGAVAGIATATGPVITQVFLTIANWRWVMWINIPIVLACFLIAIWSLPNALGRGLKLWDTLVSSLFGLCLAGAIIGVQFISTAGSVMALGAVLLIGGTIIVVTLIKNDLKKNRGYILSPELWLDSVFLRVCLISGLLGAGLTAFYLPLAFLLDVRMHFGPIAISIIMITIAFSGALVGPFAGNLSDRIEPERIVRLGLSLFAFANVLLGLIGIFVSGGRLALFSLCAVMVVAGSGAGLAFSPLANLALRRAQVATVGRAAAFYNSVRQVSSALGGVIVATAFDTIVRLRLGHSLLINAASLREASNATADAALVCFLLIALCLATAAYMSCRESVETCEELAER